MTERWESGRMVSESYKEAEIKWKEERTNSLDKIVEKVETYDKSSLKAEKDIEN